MDRLTLWDYFWEWVTAVLVAGVVCVGLVVCGVYVLVFEVVPGVVKGWKVQ